MAKPKRPPPRKRRAPATRERTRSRTPPVEDVSDGTVVGEMELDTDRYELPRTW